MTASRNEKRKKVLKERAAARRRQEEILRLEHCIGMAIHWKRYPEARRYLEQYLQLDPGSEKALKALLWIVEDENDHAKAVSILEQLPWRQDGHLALPLAEKHGILGNPARAAEIYWHVLDARLYEGIDRRANVLGRLEHFQRAAAAAAFLITKGRPPGPSGGGAGASGPGGRPRRTDAPGPSGGQGARRGAAAAPLEIQVDLDFEAPDLKVDFTSGQEAAERVSLRRQFHALDLLKDYDELLCLEALHGVHRYWFQVETAKRVLRQFHGRVLLADEVGLGKTIEAGMVIKEYLLRGLAKKVLILTPPNIVGQWREEMSTKFALDFVDAAPRRLDPEFWRAEPLIICSIHSAKTEKVSEVLLAAEHDLVVVDEAHHLRNRNTLNWKLVNAIKRRFLILISATPVQNHLVELFNLLTLLRPGLLKTESEFRKKYLSPRNPRVPRNRDELRALMSEVMIRNTRALVDVKLPRRYATTVVAEPTPEEAEVYRRLTDLLRANPGGAFTRWEAERLLLQAGSSPFALQEGAGALRDRVGQEADAVLEALARVRFSAKVEKALELVRARAGKKILFANSLRTLEYLSEKLAAEGIPHAIFHGSLPIDEKDRAIEEFRGGVDLLLSSDSGGEGRNLQFCSAMLNFDLPWNPMRIEQRIGRIHRIGQDKEVFILNFCTRGTLEEKVLQLLHEKINMFELVVGEIDGILGQLPEEREFSEVVLDLWLHPGGEAEVERGFEALSQGLTAAKQGYEEVVRTERELFGDDLEV